MSIGKTFVVFEAVSVPFLNGYLGRGVWTGCGNFCLNEGCKCLGLMG